MVTQGRDLYPEKKRQLDQDKDKHYSDCNMNIDRCENLRSHIRIITAQELFPQIKKPERKILVDGHRKESRDY
jgi:hypothetical protein